MPFLRKYFCENIFAKIFFIITKSSPQRAPFRGREIERRIFSALESARKFAKVCDGRVDPHGVRAVRVGGEAQVGRLLLAAGAVGPRKADEKQLKSMQAFVHFTIHSLLY
jgi:hypothetical protein